MKITENWLWRDSSTSSEPRCLTIVVCLSLVKMYEYMSTLGHGRLATLHDLHTVMPKHAVTYIITCLEINRSTKKKYEYMKRCIS